MTIGERLRARRKELRLTMNDIFAQENIKTGNLSELENDKYLPSVQTLISLSRALNCSIDWLLTGKENFASESLNSEFLISDNCMICDGVPLGETEKDLIAMCRLLDDRDRQTIFDIATMKYEQASGKKGSSYSTYTDTGPHKNGPEMGFRDTSETA